MKNTPILILIGLGLLIAWNATSSAQTPPPDIEATVQAAIDRHVAEYHQGEVPASHQQGTLPAPTLLDPPPNESIYARQDGLFPGRFRWHWDGKLAPNEMFELRIWREGLDPVSLGGYDVRDAKVISTIAEEEVERERGTQYLIHYDGDGIYWIDYNPAGSETIEPAYKTYVWTVAVVQVEPYQRTGEEAPPRPINIQIVDPPTPTPITIQ